MPSSLDTMNLTMAASVPRESGVADDHPDTSGNNTLVDINGAWNAGNIGVEGDVDRFRVQLSAGVSYRFELSSGTGTLYTSQLMLLSESGSTITSNTGSKTGAAQISYTAPASGTYYLDAMGINGSTGAYTVRAVQTATAPVTPQPDPVTPQPDPVTSDDFPAGTDTAGVVVPNSSAASGLLERGGDADFFKVTLQANAVYTFTLQGNGGGLVDTVLSLRSADGAVLASDDDGAGSKNGGSRINFTAPAGGNYYLDVSSDRNETGAYTLQALQVSTPVTPVTPGTPQPDPVATDDYPATTATSGVIVPNGDVARGDLERAGDSDYFKVSLEANASYSFALAGSGALHDTFLRLRAPDGGLLAENDDGSGTKNGGSQIYFTAPATATYYLDVSSDRNEIGAYAVQVTQTSTPVTPVTPVTPPPNPVTLDDYQASTATAGLITVNGATVRGVLEAAYDVDWLRVDLQAGGLYQMDVEGAPSNTGGTALAAPSVALRAADGTLLSLGGKGSAGRTTFAAPADGSYYISVQARDGSSTGTYAVKATTLPDDYASSPATTGVVRIDGSATTGRIDAPADADYFKVQLEEGTAYTFSLFGTDGPGSLVDTLLRVRSVDGKELAANDDAGTKNSSSRLTFTAPASGTYYLEAAGDGNLVGGYRLTALSIPALTQAVPANDAANVARSANVVLTFDRPVQANQGHVSITAPDGAIAAFIDLGDTSQVAIDGRVVTINPANDLTAGKRYVVSIADGALKDASGNPLGGLGDLLSFTTLAGNRAPSAQQLHTFTAVPGSSVTGRLATAVDPDGDSVTYELDVPPQQGVMVIEPDGRFTYEPGLGFTGIDQFRFRIRDSQGASANYGSSVGMLALPVVEGTSQNDSLAAAPGANRYAGLDGNDRITTGPDSDVVDAGAGLDTVVVSSLRRDATLKHRWDGGWTLNSQTSGTDHLFHVERLQFTDRSTALDLTGNAGQAARVVGAVLGIAQLKDAALVGRYLALVDSGLGGEQLVHQVLADPLFASLAGSRSNNDVVKHVYTNLVGKGPSAEEVSYYTSLITDGYYTQDSLLWLAASLDLTAQRIDLNGLADHGLEFLPAPGA